MTLQGHLNRASGMRKEFEQVAWKGFGLELTLKRGEARGSLNASDNEHGN